MYEHGEVVLIPVPFSNLSATKKRPVLVKNDILKIVADEITRLVSDKSDS